MLATKDFEKNYSEMEGLKSLLINDVTISNKTLRQADAILKNMLEKNAENAIQDLSQLFFSNDSTFFPHNFLQHAITQIKNKNLEEQFTKLNNEKILTSFWNTENPNSCAIINYSTLYGNETTFGGKELLFIEKICNNVEKFSSPSFKVLPKTIESFISYINTKPELDFSPLEGKVENIFEKQNLSLYFATAFLKVVSKDVDYESTCIVRFIVESMVSAFDRQTLLDIMEKESKIADLLQSRMTRPRYLFFLAELSRQLKSHENALKVFDYIKEMVYSSTDPDILTLCYNGCALLIVTVEDILAKIPDCADFMLRDFNTANDPVRLALCRLFEAIIKRAEKEDKSKDVAHFFVDKFIDIPWNSKLKKFTMPTLLKNVSPDRSKALLETLLSASEDQNNQPFVGKCVSSFADQKDICLTFIDVMIEVARKTQQNKSLIPLSALLSPLFHSNKDLVEEMKKRVIAVPERFAKAWLLFDLTISAPSVSKSKEFVELVRNDLSYGRRSGNWDLRSRSISAFACGGFPYTENDCKNLLDDLEVVMLTDSTIQQTSIAESFSDLFRRISTQTKKFSVIDTNKFLSSLLSIVTHHMNSQFIPTQRKFAFTIASSLWRYFPQIGTELDFKLLASLLNDRGFEVRQQVISTMRELCKQQRIAEYFAAFHSEDIDTFVIRAEKKQAVTLTEKDFPKEYNVEILRKFKIILARNDTKLDNFEFFKNTLFSQILNREFLDKTHWEIQSELFGIISYIVTKLHQIFTVEEVENTTRFIFEHLLYVRKPGLVCSSVETVERLLKVIYMHKDYQFADNITNYLISMLKGFDMAQMRRSAGLPYMALALIRSEPSSSPLNLFPKLVNALVDLVHTTDDTVEATNAMNIMKAVVNESEVAARCEPMYSTILGCVFDACYRFTDWDVISAIDLTIVAFLRKTCSIGGIDAASRTSIIRTQFFSKIKGARDIIINALKSNCLQANYIAMQILELFKPDTGDSEIQKEIICHLSSRLSRIRRVAARALFAVIGVSERIEQFKQLAAKLGQTDWNTFHGIVLTLNAIAKASDVSGIRIPQIELNKIPPMAREDYTLVLIACKQETGELKLVQGPFISDEAAVLAHLGMFSNEMTPRTIVPLLRKWGSKPASQEMLRSLLQSIINDNVLTMNEAYSINTTQFLITKLPKNFIESNKLSHILQLFEKAHSIALRAALLSLVAFVDSPDIAEIEKYKNIFLECVLDLSSRMAPIHIALSSISSLLLKSQTLLPVVLLLTANDVPIVRTQVLKAYSEMKSIDLVSEKVVIDDLISIMSDAAKHEVGHKWIEKLDALSQIDKWGEPMSLFVDEFYIPTLCIKGLGDKIASIDPLLPIIDMRKAFLEIAKQFI